MLYKPSITTYWLPKCKGNKKLFAWIHIVLHPATYFHVHRTTYPQTCQEYHTLWFAIWSFQIRVFLLHFQDVTVESSLPAHSFPCIQSTFYKVSFWVETSIRLSCAIFWCNQTLVTIQQQTLILWFHMNPILLIKFSQTWVMALAISLSLQIIISVNTHSKQILNFVSERNIV